MDVIQNHPHMILRKKYFSAIRINWDDKVKNIKSLAEEINIGLDSLVFIDDDPMNREMVQKFLPEVAVIDLPKDSSMYVDTLINMNYFENYKDQTILITGGAGAIGSNLVRKLAEAGAEKVIILDDNTSKNNMPAQ